MPLLHVLGGALLLWAVFAAAVRLTLRFAARDEPCGDGVDSMKTSLSGLSHLGDFQHEFEARAPPGGRNRAGQLPAA